MITPAPDSEDGPRTTATKEHDVVHVDGVDIPIVGEVDAMTGVISWYSERAE